MENKTPKILFYAGTPYGFRSWAIWEVFKIAQKYPIVLLSEKLDVTTERLLNNKNYFPKLEKIIYFKNDVKKIVRNNSKIHKELKKIISKERPDIAIDCGKYVYLLDLYFRRISRRIGARRIAYLGIQPVATKELSKWKLLMNAYSENKSFFLMKLKKYLSHFFVYYILPIFVGEMPFIYEPGGIILKNVFSRSSDFYVCFLEKEYQLCLNEGADKNKLFLIQDVYPEEYEAIRRENNPVREKNQKKLLLIWPSEKIGIKRADFNRISESEVIEKRLRIVIDICSVLKDWVIFVKPHPSIIKDEFLKLKNLLSGFKNIQIIKPSESADDYTQICDVFVGMPPVSSTSYTASLSYPEKPILCLNLDGQFMGDTCKSFNGVEYIDNEADFIRILKEIKEDRYIKKQMTVENKNLQKGKISNIIELIERISKKNEQWKQ
jgi:hypothetical protein